MINTEKTALLAEDEDGDCCSCASRRATDATGLLVGCGVGMSVGAAVGLAVGVGLGTSVGAVVGAAVGTAVGPAVGAFVGNTVGGLLAVIDGAPVGSRLSGTMGLPLGATVVEGAADGDPAREGAVDGRMDGENVEDGAGEIDGAIDGGEDKDGAAVDVGGKVGSTVVLSAAEGGAESNDVTLNVGLLELAACVAFPIDGCNVSVPLPVGAADEFDAEMIVGEALITDPSIEGAKLTLLLLPAGALEVVGAIVGTPGVVVV
jgi:hypothetical protein